jgi:hypothetical protein
MSALSELRNSEAGVAVAEAWRWWTGELAAMAPERFRPDRGKRPSADIRLGRDAVEIEVVSDGVGQRYADPQPLEALDADGWTELGALIAGCRTRIVLEPPDVYIAHLTLPAAARRRLKSAVGLQLSQISPLDPSRLRWAMAVTDGNSDRIVVQVAMTRSDRVENLRALFAEHGIDPPPICAATAEATLELAPGNPRAAAAAGRAGRREWAIAALLLASIPLTTTLAATVLEASTKSRIETIAKRAAPRLKAEAGLRRSEGLRRGLQPLFTRPGVSATVEELAARLPLTDHVKSVTQAADRSVELVVETADAEAVEAALRGSRLLPRAAVADILPASEGRLIVTYRTAPR